MVLAVFLCCCLSANAQFFSLDSTKRANIPFQLVRNLVVIKLKINNKGPYNFVLDTGVGFMLITEPSLVDSINIASKRIVKITGLGAGKNFEAYVTPLLKIDIPGLVSHNINAAIFKEDHFGISNYAGITIHGLIGYEFFNHLAVKLSFSDTTMTVSLPKDMRYYKHADKLPLSIEDRKPYLTTKVTFTNGTEKQSKLIVDLGAGHFISMENVENKTDLQKKYINANLGMGINGLISGTLSRISSVELGKYKIRNVIAAFPDSNTRALAVPRDGNIGIGLLKKFDVIIDYPDGVIYLKPGPEYHTRDEYDMSGLVYYAAQDELKHIIISYIEPGTAGDIAGLKKNDEIIGINFKSVSPMSMQQIDNLFKSDDDRPLVLMIYRDKKYYNIIITLKRRI